MQISGEYDIILMMEFPEANRILRNVKAIFQVDGYKLPPALETDGIMVLLGKTDAERYLKPKCDRIRDSADAVKSRLTIYPLFIRALQLTSELSMQFALGTVTLSLIHKRLCGDFLQNGGALRTTNISSGDNAHADYKLIYGSLKSMLSKMSEIESSPKIAKDDFLGYITNYMREFIILCPFENYSSLVMRIFFSRFCENKGFALCYYKNVARIIHDAEDNAFVTDNVADLYQALLPCVTYRWRTSAEREIIPRSRREINAAPRTDEIAKPTKNLNDKKSTQDDEAIRRAVKLQQKIAKLNEQLTDVIKDIKPHSGQ